MNATTARHVGNNLATVVHDHEQRLLRIERLAAIRTVTRDPLGFLRRAIGSVKAQLVAVDDGSAGGTAELLEDQAVTEHRRCVLRTGGVDAAAARNVGLDAAVGDIVVYLDDDNTLDPLWLKAVVWAFTQHPEVDVVYGARLIDDIDRVLGTGVGALPTIQFEPFDRRTLERGNTADMGVLAHRTGLAEARFDPELTTHADWNLFLRLTEARSPLELPVVACHYVSDSPNRLSEIDGTDADQVLAKLTRTAG